VSRDGAIIFADLIGKLDALYVRFPDLQRVTNVRFWPIADIGAPSSALVQRLGSHSPIRADVRFAAQKRTFIQRWH
jgi:hypothetical protein